MRKFYFVLSFMLTLFSLSSFAEGIHIGYCEGQIATSSTGLVTGMTGNNAEIQGAIFITPEMLKAYSSCQITSLYVGMAKGAAAYPETLTGWVRTDKAGENITSGSVAGAEGWNTITLDKAIDVKDYTETGIWIGFSYVQPKKLSVLALLQGEEVIENSGWIAKKGTWTDYSNKGMLPLEAIVEGEGLPQRDLAILSAKASPKIIKIGGDIKLKVTVKNNALVTAENPVIKYNIADGAITGSYTIDGSLAYREKKDVEITIPASAITEEIDAKAALELAWADGNADDADFDNTASVDLTFAKDVFYKRMLCEEGTGSWCGWCVRGIVGLKTMREEHPDTFIGIGVHNGDEYAVTAYDNWMGGQISGYPSCLIDRDGTVYDPSYAELEAVYEQMEVVANADIDVSAKVTSDGLVINSNTTFAANEEGTSYNIVYVVREDQCPITQHNYYSGGSYGEMGGFENEGSTADILLDDIARAVYPSPEGEAIDTPASIVKGTPYAHALTVETPEVLDWANTCIVAILVDNATGKVVNANTGKIEDVLTGINNIDANTNTNNVYNLAGQRLAQPMKGINIIGGKKVLK